MQLLKSSTIKYISYAKFLKQTDNGKNVFEHFLPDLELKEAKRFKNICNPHYDDSNAGLSIYLGDDGKWKYKDHGDDSFQGDCIDWAAYEYNLDRQKDFKEILSRLAIDMNLDISTLGTTIDSRVYNQGFIFNGEFRRDPDGLEYAYAYFKQYGITKEVLHKYCVRAVKEM